MPSFVLLAAAALLSAPALGAIPDGIVHFPIDRLEPESLSRRASDGTIDGILSNMKTYYALRCSLGTPPQELRMVLDTGSSDFWVMSPDTEECQSGKCHPGSIFDSSKSSSFSNNHTSFYQQYADTTSAKGSWAQDVLTFGGANISNFNFAVADHSNSSQTVAGIGLADGETPYILQTISTPYENLPMQLKSHGYISHVAYSLYLDNFSDGVGSVLFGGVNTGAYENDLYLFPMVPVDTPNSITRLAIKLDSIYLMDDKGDQQMAISTSIPVVFDSGSTISAFPSYMIDSLMNSIGAQYYEGTYLIECDSLADNHGGLGFTFSNVEFVVNFRDLLVEVAESRGVKVCTPFTDGDIPILGDNVLRALYVVYDLENLEIGIAKANTASSISTSYQTIGSSLPGTRAPGYSSSDVQSNFQTLPITLFSGGASASGFESVSDALSGDATATATAAGAGGASAAASSLPTNDVSVTIGGKDSSSGLATPYGGFGSRTTREASVSTPAAGAAAGGSGGSSSKKGNDNSQSVSSATTSGTASSTSDSSSSSSRSRSKNNAVPAANTGLLSGALAAGVGIFFMLI